MNSTEPGVEFRIMPSGGRDSRWYWEVIIDSRTVVTRGVADTEPAACQEASAFSTSPGGAMTYQIGKLQIVKFLAGARMQQGDKFNLRTFHDFLWKNGNVPIALQEWEYLGGR